MATVNLKPADVAVIGLGAAGGVAVLPLARAGLRVVGLEAGTWMDPHSFRADEIYNNVRRMVNTIPKFNREIPTVRDSATGAMRPRGNFHPMMNAVGGTSIHYWASHWRLKEWDFQARSEIIRRYGGQAIPAGSTLEDWPITYHDLEPYYDIVEHEVGVSGKAGNIQGKLDPAGNIFEAPRKREYPMPPLRGSGYNDLMMKAAHDLGWHPFRGPAAINSQEYRGRPACALHGFCGTGGCHISAKNSTAVTTIPEAVKTKNLTVVERADVRRIVSDANGKVTGVAYLRDGQEYFQPAKVVLVGSYTYENSRLLLLSKSKAYPNGLANNHGQVGRHYFAHHQGGGVSALFPFDINVWYGAPAQSTVVDDFGDDNFDHASAGFMGGSTLTAATEMHPIEAASMDTFGHGPTWGSKWKAFVRDNAPRWNTSYLQTSSFPYETSFLDLDPTVKDAQGDPVTRVTTGGPKRNEGAAVQFAQKKMEEWFRAAGAIEVRRPSGAGGAPGLTTHAYGGTRMGDNPYTSVVDKWGMSHEAPNLGVVGGSVMGTSGARNPTETVQALAWRTAEHVVKNWKSIAG